MKCAKCGYFDDGDFCSYCGAPLTKHISVQPGAAAAAMAPEQTSINGSTDNEEPATEAKPDSNWPPRVMFLTACLYLVVTKTNVRWFPSAAWAVEFFAVLLVWSAIAGVIAAFVAASAKPRKNFLRMYAKVLFIMSCLEAPLGIYTLYLQWKTRQLLGF